MTAPRIDTGDAILHRPTCEPHLVACVHGDGPHRYVHTVGYPELRLLAHECTLVRSATDTERRAHLTAMAASTGTGHRPRCARERMANDPQLVGEADA